MSSTAVLAPIHSVRVKSRATVVWVQAAPPRGVGTPRAVSARASAACDTWPTARKRGNVATGAGADRIDVQVVSNLSTWSHAFRIASGAGDDDVRVGLLDVLRQRLEGDVTFAEAARGAGPDAGYRGESTTAWIDLGSGSDRLFVGGYVRADVDAGAGDDHVELAHGAGTVRGGDGQDTLRGGYGADHLLGDDGADTLVGGDSARESTLDGGAGDDWLNSGVGSDHLLGGAGADTILGGAYGDTIVGGEGDDSLSGDDGQDHAVYAGRAGDYALAVSYSNGTRAVTIGDRNPVDGDEGIDTLSSVEQLRFADQEIPVSPSRRSFLGFRASRSS